LAATLFMRHIAATFALVLLFCVAGNGQQTGLTDAQIRSADVEVPQLVQLLELEPGMAVADVGAGFGAWTMRFARWLGPKGRVYATDVGATQLAALRNVVQREQLTTVTVVEGAIDATNLPAACCDAILIRDAYHHLTQPEAMIRSLAASLKPGGRLAVIDFPPRANSEVPSGVAADRGGHGVPSEVVQREVGRALAHVRTIAPWSPASQPASLYLVLFRKT
jgi:ubiquinone/menaquinone biosynthesis C-methylase UbiE